MILHRYFARRFLLSFAAIFALFLALLSLVDVVEQLREFGGEGVPFRDILQLAVLNVPRALYQILPLLVIITTVTLFLSLARSSEMVVTRAAGRSARCSSASRARRCRSRAARYTSHPSC